MGTNKFISIGGFTNPDEWKKHPFAIYDDATLDNHRKKLTDIMLANGVHPSIYALFELAFDYFIEHPNKYDGASGDIELHKIDNVYYDIPAIIHDYLDAIGYTYSFSRLRKSDKVFEIVMRQMGISDWHQKKRVWLLWLVAPVRFVMRKKKPYKKNLDDLINVIIDGNNA